MYKDPVGKFTSPASSSAKASATGSKPTGGRSSFAAKVSAEAHDRSKEALTSTEHVQAAIAHDRAANTHKIAAAGSMSPDDAIAHSEAAASHAEASRVHTVAAGTRK